ncbi:hypothetical protein F2P81_015279 [Scophthalmus maximus]|uniref:Uncharacterized protein n=1 Tax=Scophthalmus maximus TaxID=52904 RepID=A0A6A4SK99_SCOMX|nr:hypothetical protein F2P81_015279 [Scophthalmus maximus]
MRSSHLAVYARRVKLTASLPSDVIRQPSVTDVLRRVVVWKVHRAQSPKKDETSPSHCRVHWSDAPLWELQSRAVDTPGPRRRDGDTRDENTAAYCDIAPTNRRKTAEREGAQAVTWGCGVPSSRHHAEESQ